MQDIKLYELYARMMCMGGWVGTTFPVFGRNPAVFLQQACEILFSSPFLYTHMRERRRILRDLIRFIRQD